MRIFLTTRKCSCKVERGGYKVTSAVSAEGAASGKSHTKGAVVGSPVSSVLTGVAIQSSFRCPQLENRKNRTQSGERIQELPEGIACRKAYGGQQESSSGYRKIKARLIA